MTSTGDFRPALMQWYRRHGRHDLPWRLTRDPYAILVSEVMLQQTQVERVLPYYECWLARWPTVDALAASSPADVIREWAGLGYNRRALYLHRSAVAVVERDAGCFPADVAALRALPGVGPYTSTAIAAFAHGRRVAVVDTNIARVLARVTGGVASHRDLPRARVSQAANDLLPARKARDHNLALMDLGASICTARTPRCDECPIRRYCAWYAAGAPPPISGRARTTPPFESTARYARGRIINALRQAPSLDEAALSSKLPESHHASLLGYLEALANDGLVVHSGSRWSLPG